MRYKSAWSFVFLFLINTNLKGGGKTLLLRNSELTSEAVTRGQMEREVIYLYIYSHIYDNDNIFNDNSYNYWVLSICQKLFRYMNFLLKVDAEELNRKIGLEE